jgi:hypothetical protein
MSQPEENEAKTAKTDDVLPPPGERAEVAAGEPDERTTRSALQRLADDEAVGAEATSEEVA